jgi:hypothetical protein
MSEHTLSAKTRKKIKEAKEKAEKDRRIAMFKMRMNIAREGVLYYQKGNYKEAIEHFYRYLAILEEWKKVKPGNLELSQFDLKKDVAELLLLSGIFWDLAKVHDRSAKKDKSKLKFNLDKFVMFSKGMPYQYMCAELIRKYLMNNKPVNRAMFKDAHIRLGGSKCFIATSVEEYCDEQTLPRLRKFRDQKLMSSKVGRLMVSVYYQVGPWIARGILRLPESSQRSIARTLNVISFRFVQGEK